MPVSQTLRMYVCRWKEGNMERGKVRGEDSDGRRGGHRWKEGRGKWGRVNVDGGRVCREG